MKRIAWITGAAGFLGRNTVPALEASGWRVIGLGHPPRVEVDARPASETNRMPTFVEGPLDITCLDRALALSGAPDLVLHAVGNGSVGPSFSDPLTDFQRAVVPTAVLLDVLRRHAPAARLVMVSSAAVYGVQPDAPISENTAPAPVSPYGAHKLAAEILCRQACVSFGQKVTILRFFSLFGPGLRKQLLWDLSSRLTSRPKRLELAGTGEETRDMLHVSDAAALIALVAEVEWSGLLLLNGGTGRRSTVRAIAEGLVRRLSPETELFFSGEIRNGDPRHLVADAARASALGFTPRLDLDAGLDIYAAWRRSLAA